MSSRAEKQRPLPARRRKHHMPRLASSGIRFARPNSAVTLNSAAAAHSKEAQKVTPWKNHLTETKPLIGIYARPPVSPCRSQSEPSFCLTRRARASCTVKACHARSPETPQRIPHSQAPSDSCPFRRAFPPTEPGILTLHKPAISTLRRLAVISSCTGGRYRLVCEGVGGKLDNA